MWPPSGSLSAAWRKLRCPAKWTLAPGVRCLRPALAESFALAWRIIVRRFSAAHQKFFASHRPVGKFNLRENQSDFKEKIAYQAA
jgi:hypothetical protein